MGEDGWTFTAHIEGSFPDERTRDLAERRLDACAKRLGLFVLFESEDAPESGAEQG